MTSKEKLKVAAIMIFVALFVGISISWQQNKSIYGKSTGQVPETIEIAMQKQLIKVHISGAVVNPGVYLTNANSRAQDVLKLAGGFLPDADVDRFNLARRCFDGLQLRVYHKKSSKNIKKENVKQEAVNDAKININTAGQQEWESLDGIGPVLAKNIIEYRQKNGNFKSICQLLDVKGIGQSKFENIKERLIL